MPRIIVFNHVTLDGYFVDGKGDMSWAHSARNDSEWNGFVDENARGSAVLMFGRKTYDLMAGYWPTPMAMQSAHVVAEKMNSAQKIVFSRTLVNASWQNARLVKSDLVTEVSKMKKTPGEDMVIFGSGTIVSQLAEAGLIDEYQFALNLIALGSGRTLFEGLKDRVQLKLTKIRAFSNGNVMLWYTPAT
jgi:dihydrofolate reductase